MGVNKQYWDCDLLVSIDYELDINLDSEFYI